MGICAGERESKIHWASRRPHHPSSCIIKLLRPLMNSAWNEPTKLSILINYYPKRYEEKKRERGRVTGGKREGKEECSRALSCLQLLLGNLHLMTTMRKQNTYQIICNKFHTHTGSTHTHTHTCYTHTHSCIGGPVKLSVIKSRKPFRPRLPRNDAACPSIWGGDCSPKRHITCPLPWSTLLPHTPSSLHTTRSHYKRMQIVGRCDYKCDFRFH